MAQSRRTLLQGSVMAALGAVAVAPAAAQAAQQNPDAELIRLCEEYVALDREFLRLCHDDRHLLADDPRSVAIHGRQDVIVDRSYELRDEIAGWMAETPEGARALIQAARHTLSSDADRGAVDLLEGTEIAWAAIESALALLDGGRALA